MDKVRAIFADRPLWMNALMLFCGYMTFIYMPFDMFIKPVAEDREVWFGFMLSGWMAKATEPLHWLIYGFGFYGFLKMKNWMWPWAGLYVIQVAIGMFVWAMLYAGGMIVGAIAGLLFGALAVQLLRSRKIFQEQKPDKESGSEDLTTETETKD